MFKDLHASLSSLSDEDLVLRGIVDWLEGTCMTKYHDVLLASCFIFCLDSHALIQFRSGRQETSVVLLTFIQRDFADPDPEQFRYGCHCVVRWPPPAGRKYQVALLFSG